MSPKSSPGAPVPKTECRGVLVCAAHTVGNEVLKQHSRRRAAKCCAFIADIGAQRHPPMPSRWHQLAITASSTRFPLNANGGCPACVEGLPHGRRLVGEIGPRSHCILCVATAPRARLSADTCRPQPPGFILRFRVASGMALATASGIAPTPRFAAEWLAEYAADS
jgi:hypothetical protein